MKMKLDLILSQMFQKEIFKYGLKTKKNKKKQPVQFLAILDCIAFSSEV